MTVKKILEAARSQIGERESPPDSNRIRYNTAYYGREVSGDAYPWCCVFQWWLFRETGASRLFYGGGKTASCTTLYHYYQQRGQTIPIQEARPGDLIFFTFSEKDKQQGIRNHVGVCEANESGYITTIDGNTGTVNEANGGEVMRRRRPWRDVTGAARPAYEEEIDMTKEEIQKLIDDAVSAVKPQVYTDADQAPEWARGLVKRAVEAGILQGDDSGNLYLTTDNLVNLQILSNSGIF